MIAINEVAPSKYVHLNETPPICSREFIINGETHIFTATTWEELSKLLESEIGNLTGNNPDAKGA